MSHYNFTPLTTKTLISFTAAASSSTQPPPVVSNLLTLQANNPACVSLLRGVSSPWTTLASLQSAETFLPNITLQLLAINGQFLERSATD